jgi:hypoxanthine phosphoribosyltransferase
MRDGRQLGKHIYWLETCYEIVVGVAGGGVIVPQG